MTQRNTFVKAQLALLMQMLAQLDTGAINNEATPSSKIQVPRGTARMFATNPQIDTRWNVRIRVGRDANQQTVETELRSQTQRASR